MHNITINKAIDYIMTHLEENITVEDIAEHCNFSKYYFNRLFKSIVGESVYAFIKRLRIEKSAFRLSFESDKSITEIGGLYGYSSSNYSTAFKKYYGKSPVVFRNNKRNSKVINQGKYYHADLSNKDFNYYNQNMKLAKLSDFKVIYERYIGHYHESSIYWSKFLDRYKEYVDETSWCLDISYDDPTMTDENRCIIDICMTTSKPIGTDCTTMEIKGGSYMVYAFEGTPAKIFETFQGIVGVWMVQSPLNVDLEKRKIFSHYKEVNEENNYLVIDIYIPVKESTNSEVII